jgi:hypothetical protein
VREEQLSKSEDEKPRAQLRQFREGAAGIWWQRFFDDESAEIARRETLVGVIYWTEAERMPNDLFSYIREASRCFSVARYLAAIAMACCAVELVLNRDRRIRGQGKIRRIGGWAALNNPNLIAAGSLGFPIQYLCSAGEQIQPTPPLLFVERRNKVAHGDVVHMLTDISDYDANAEQEALDQIQKAQRFVIEWFNTAPDVQERHIANHRWPDQ